MEVAASRPALGLFASLALVALLAAPSVEARRVATPSLVVSFSPAGAVTVALPDGTPVGTTSGAPTVIPAGYYTLLMNGPGECINLPLFELRGPGVNINDDMLGGETDTHTLYATFQPNSTYTWHLDRTENVVYTFRTSATVIGAPVPNANSPQTPPAKAVPTSQDVTGSAITPFRGTLTVALSPAGKLSLAFKGRPVSALKAGRYAVVTTDRSTAEGVTLARRAHRPLSVTGAAFVGKRATTVVLTAGKWLVSPSAHSIAVS